MTDALIEGLLGVAALALLACLAHACRDNDRLRRKLDRSERAGRQCARLLEGRQQDHLAEVKNLKRQVAQLQLDKAELLERCGEAP